MNVHNQQNTSVLVVGDDLETASFLESSLAAVGFEVTRTSNGVEAMVQLRSRQFDLIITEFTTPRMGGEEFYEELEKDAPWAMPHVCFLTNDHNVYGVQSFLTRTGAHFLVKPFTFDQLAGVINEILSEAGS